jgi:hypothetical protein
MRQGVVAAVAAVAGAALGYAYSRLQSAPITLSKSSKKSLIDLEQDLLERGTARGESSLAQRAAAKVVTEGARVLDRVQMNASGRAVASLRAAGPHQGKPYVFRLVLTGGPCGGKSSSLAHFTEKLTQLGFEVFSAPEVPTIMMNGGCKFPGTSDDHKLMEFESALLQLQVPRAQPQLVLVSHAGCFLCRFKRSERSSRCAHHPSHRPCHVLVVAVRHTRISLPKQALARGGLGIWRVAPRSTQGCRSRHPQGSQP